MDLLNLFDLTNIEIHFQPIVSIKRKTIFGYEALVRSFDAQGYVQPYVLFQRARDLNLVTELDQFIRLMSIENFKKLYDANPKALLFLNIESSSIYQLPEKEEHLLKTLDIPFSNIVFEIKEDAIEDSKTLISLIAYYKEQGFNVAIDDFGTGNSQFDRLSLIRPDIVKIDRSLLSNVNENFINAEIIRAVAKMCNKIGATVLAEGVEAKSEILRSLDFSIDIYQGFWFGKPSKEEVDSYSIREKIITIGQEHIKHIQYKMDKKRQLFDEALTITNRIIDLIDQGSLATLPELIRTTEHHYQIEAIYFIDTVTSRQRGETFFFGKKKGFYEPNVDGDDHSLKEYYYMCNASYDGMYLSTKYISNASGNQCRTFSKKFVCCKGEMVLCIDLYLQ